MRNSRDTIVRRGVRRACGTPLSEQDINEGKREEFEISQLLDRCNTSRYAVDGVGNVVVHRYRLMIHTKGRSQGVSDDFERRQQ